MTVKTEPSVSVVRSLVRNESSHRTLSRETAKDSSEFSRVLHGESIRQPTGSAVPATTTTVAPPAAQTLHYNVQGLMTHWETSVPLAQVPVPAAQSDTPAGPPSAASVFGDNPWMTSATGHSAGLGSYSYNPRYFATKPTADKVAQLIGGTVVEKNAIVGDGGPFIQDQPNYMVQLPNGHLVNPAFTVNYYNQGWSQAQIDRMLEYDRNA